MARYIDADALLDTLEKLKERWRFTFTAEGVGEAMEKVREADTADVVPKIELEAMRTAANSYKMHYEYARREVDELREMVEAAVACQETLQKALAEAKTEVAREIFEEIEKHGLKPIPEAETIYVLSKNQFAELKKKYKEGNDEGI